MLTLAALLGLAGPALAAEPPAAKHDPQAATTTTKGHAKKAPQAHQKTSKAKQGAAKTAEPKPAAPPAQPAK
jgi:hypothetical protein